MGVNAVRSVELEYFYSSLQKTAGVMHFEKHKSSTQRELM